MHGAHAQPRSVDLHVRELRIVGGQLCLVRGTYKYPCYEGHSMLLEVPVRVAFYRTSIAVCIVSTESPSKRNFPSPGNNFPSPGNSSDTFQRSAYAYSDAGAISLSMIQYASDVWHMSTYNACVCVWVHLQRLCVCCQLCACQIVVSARDREPPQHIHSRQDCSI